MSYSHQRRLKAWALFISLTLSVGTVGATEITISTIPDWDGVTRFVAPQFGEGTVATWGQTFTVPDSTPTLTSFGVYMYGLTQDPLIFGGYLMQWNGQQAAGPILYQSDPITLAQGWNNVSFGPDISLTAGQQYVFIFSALNYLDGLDRRGEVGGMPSDAYSGGEVVRLRPDNSSEWTTADWAKTSDSWDTAFSADFSSGPLAAVPDPPKPVLIAISAAFLAFAGLRRKYRVRTLKRV